MEDALVRRRVVVVVVLLRGAGRVVCVPISYGYAVMLLLVVTMVMRILVMVTRSVIIFMNSNLPFFLS